MDVGAGTPSPTSHLALELDESVQPDEAPNPAYDRYNGSETESGAGTANGGADDVAPVATNYNQTPVIETAPLAVEAIGSRTTDAGKIGQLLTGWSTAQLGADDPAVSSTKTLGFVLTEGGNPAAFVATNLTATQTGAAELVNHDAADRAIYLHEVSPTVLEGRTAGANGTPNDPSDDVPFEVQTLVGAKALRTMSVTPRLRCAIYTRKSSEEGLEQDFNSLDAQREACEAFVASQVGSGWNSFTTAMMMAASPVGRLPAPPCSDFSTM